MKRSICVPFPARRKTKYGRRPRSNPSGRRTEIRTRNPDAFASITPRRIVFTKQTASKTRKTFSQVKVGGYVGVFLLLVGVIAIGYQSPRSTQSLSKVSVSNLVATDDSSDVESPSVDQIVATDIAASLTERTNLPIASSVANMSVSLAAKSELAQSDDTTISKPQILQPDSVSRDIRYYKVERGESVADVANKFAISANTVRWANNLDTDALRQGQKIKILPTDGIQHTVKSGESVEDLAQKYKTSVDRITSYNDLELSKPKVGQKLIIPSGVLPASERPGYEPPVAAGQQFIGSGSTISGMSVTASAGNRYAPGYCTWYAYERRQDLGNPIGSFWGNANTWDDNARAAGFSVNGTPKPGAILVDNAGYYGHVAIVERVLGNGDVYLSEMNYAGFNVVSNRTISAGQAAGYTYIHGR